MKTPDRMNPCAERVILVCRGKSHQNEPPRELASLVLTAGGTPVHHFYQNIIRPNPRTYIGSGKANAIKEAVDKYSADTVVMDAELTPGQTMHLEKILDVKVLDRTELIIDIFATQARTHEARLQVELAQLKYLLPRLKRHWTHLSRQYGGMGMRGPGETQLEVDRRRVRKKISTLEKKLGRISQQRTLRRKKRTNLINVSIVGYTNAGKSTLINRLCSSSVRVENRLFTTLDSTTRRRHFSGLKKTVLFTDTVGFIRNLPHHLVAAFRSTLEVVLQADLLLILLDASDKELDEKLETVESVLKELGVLEKSRMLVLNKMDIINNKNPFIIGRKNVEYYVDRCYNISAKTGLGVPELLEGIKKYFSNGCE